jgi:methylmalonyl-CoA mutase cobalamin-binding subunit
MWNLVFLQMLLEEHGIEVINLGICVPDEVIIEQCRHSRPDALIVSTVNGHGYLDGLRLIERLRSQPDLVSLRVVIGGKLGIRGADNAQFVEELKVNGYDAVFEASAGVTAFEEYLQTLSPAQVPALATSAGAAA